MTESQNSSQIPLKPKGVYKNFKSWKFLDTIQEDALTGEFKDRKQLQIEHFRTRTTPCAIFVDLKPVVLAQPNQNEKTLLSRFSA